MAEVQDIVRVALDIDAVQDGNQERLAALVARATAKTEDELGLRLTELEAAGKKVGNAKAVVGDPRWDSYTDNDGVLILRVTVQGHLVY